jgi:hypothetical protein
MRFILLLIVSTTLISPSLVAQRGQFGRPQPKPYFNPLGQTTNFVLPVGKSPLRAFGTGDASSSSSSAASTNLVLDFEGGVNGSVIGTNLIHTFAIGTTNLSSAGPFQVQSNGVTVTGTVSMVTSTAQAARGTRSMRVDFSVDNVQILMTLKTSNVVMSYGFAFRMDGGFEGTTFSSYNYADFHSSDGAEYATVNLFDASPFEIGTQTSVGLSSPISMATSEVNKWKWVTIKWDGTIGRSTMRLYDYAGSGVLGTEAAQSPIFEPFTSTPKYPFAALFGRPDNHDVFNPGAFLYLDDFVINWDGTFPVLPP